MKLKTIQAEKQCSNGKCTCINNRIDGEKCNSCKPDHYKFPDCLDCKCNADGSKDSQCNVKSGDCDCKTKQIIGRKCDSCADQFFGFPGCTGMFWVFR